jgi:16S rRNA (cytidine1402-2'-O)-methyltransferase
MTKPALLLFPNVLGDVRHHELYLPSSVDHAVETIDGLIAESESGGRRFLSRFKHAKKPQEIPLALLNEHTPDSDLDFLLEPIRQGERWGLVSDAGLPCIADPGSKLVARARRSGIVVQAFSGPSSILLSLMQSGLPGQRFAFHGYLEKDPIKVISMVRRLEKRSKEDLATQIFMEAPYRNQALLNVLLQSLSDETLLACAWELTLPEQGILSQPVGVWKKSPLPVIDKKRVIFMIYAPG